MKKNPHQRSEASSVQATADFIVQMEWGAIRHVPPMPSGEQFAYISDRNDPKLRGCVYLIARLNKGEAHKDIGMNLFMNKDKRPNVQINITHSGVVTIAYAGTWPDAIPHPTNDIIFKIGDGDLKAYRRLRDEVRAAAMRTLATSFGPLAGTVHTMATNQQKMLHDLDQARRTIEMMRKTGVTATAATHMAQVILKEGISAPATARFGGLPVSVTVTTPANNPDKRKVEPS